MTSTKFETVPLPDAFECPVCMEPMQEVATLMPCCHKLCMGDAAQVNGRCPVCRSDVAHYAKDHTMTEIVEEALRQDLVSCSDCAAVVRRSASASHVCVHALVALLHPLAPQLSVMALRGIIGCWDPSVQDMDALINMVHEEKRAAAGDSHASAPSQAGLIKQLNVDTRTTTAFIDAIGRDARNSQAYCNLGAWLAAGEKVTLKDGRVLTKRQCFTEAIDCDARNSSAYVNLSETLGADDWMMLKNDCLMSKRQCLVKAIDCDARNSSAYASLGASLAVGEKVTLKDGRVLTKRQCFTEAIDCDARNSSAYVNLGACLAVGGSVTLKDGCMLTKSQCFMEAIDCDARNSSAYASLGASLAVGEKVTLKDGRVLTKRQCFTEAIDCDARNSNAYINLGGLLAAEQEAMSKDGCVVTKSSMKRIDANGRYLLFD